MTQFIIKCRDWWFTDCNEGDPPRTLLEENATIFNSYDKANNYLKKMIKKNPHRDLSCAEILPYSKPIKVVEEKDA